MTGNYGALNVAIERLAEEARHLAFQIKDIQGLLQREYRDKTVSVDTRWELFTSVPEELRTTSSSVFYPDVWEDVRDEVEWERHRTIHLVEELECIEEYRHEVDPQYLKYCKARVAASTEENIRIAKEQILQNGDHYMVNDW